MRANRAPGLGLSDEASVRRQPGQHDQPAPGGTKVIDAFVWECSQQHGLLASEVTDRRVLLRRGSFRVTGRHRHRKNSPH
ncbi:MAG UNVERIFIED_CONTAM: hypothetical protein LVR18_19935 [Planctomycetaceae bacterium]